MQRTEDAEYRTRQPHEDRRTSRTRLADRFEVLVAASQADSICPVWIADRLSDGEGAL